MIQHFIYDPRGDQHAVSHSKQGFLILSSERSTGSAKGEGGHGYVVSKLYQVHEIIISRQIGVPLSFHDQISDMTWTLRRRLTTTWSFAAEAGIYSSRQSMIRSVHIVCAGIGTKESCSAYLALNGHMMRHSTLRT